MRLMSIGITIVIILFLFLLFYSIAWRPFAAEITQDRPIVKWLCEKQMECRSVVGPFPCIDNRESDIYKTLSKLKDFHGCNNMTEGYFITDVNRVYIQVEVCSCGGIM